MKQKRCNSHEIEQVSFRDLYSDVIPSTTYLTHGIYFYPGKFIPQIARYCIDNFSKEGDYIYDPFAGSGTLAVEAVLSGRYSISCDISPLSHTMIWAKANTYGVNDYNKYDFDKLLSLILARITRTAPDWERIYYWYDSGILNRLARIWDGVNEYTSLENDTFICYKDILVAAFMRIARKYSYTDDKVSKSFRSRKKAEKIAKILYGNWVESIEQDFIKFAYDYYDRIVEFSKHKKEMTSTLAFTYTGDSSEYILSRSVDAVITSPPYLQAQEYIRSIKLQLYWLGLTTEQIRGIQRKEIPYRKSESTIDTPAYREYRDKITKPDLLALYDSYFWYTTRSLENAVKALRKGGYICILTGNAKVQGVPIPIWCILKEYFEARGLIVHSILEDKIVSRHTVFNKEGFENNQNIPSEMLLTMVK